MHRRMAGVYLMTELEQLLQDYTNDNARILKFMMGWLSPSEYYKSKLHGRRIKKNMKNQVKDEDDVTEQVKGASSAPAKGQPKRPAKRSGASQIMQAVAKAVQNTPGKSGKKSTVGPKDASKPTSSRQTAAFKKSSNKQIPHDAANSLGEEEIPE